MKLHYQFILYLVVVHLVCGALFIVVAGSSALALLILEIVCIISFIIVFRLFRRFFAPFQLVVDSADFLKERDFSSLLQPVGHPETDSMINVFNSMMAGLREERLRLQEQEHLLSTIIQETPAGMMILGFDGDICNVNPRLCRIFRLQPEELIGKHLRDTSLPLAQPFDTMPTGQSEIFTIEHRYFKVHKARFMDRGFARLFFIVEELTEELRANEKAAYNRVIRLLAHEVNNSVGAIVSLLSSCLTYASQISPTDRADFTTALNVAITRIEQLSGFMNRYAEVIKLPVPNKQPVDVVPQVEQALALFSEIFREHSITVEWRIKTEPGTIMMDKTQMNQVWINIIKNAVEAIGNNGAVIIHCGVIKAIPFVAIEDTGIGLLQTGDTPFFSAKPLGQGIGLTFAREVCEAHGFTLRLEQPPGEHTSCRIVFGLLL